MEEDMVSDMVADLVADLVANMLADIVADMEVDKVSDRVADNGLDAFYLNRLIQLNVFLSLVLDTLFMVSSPSLIEKFPGGVFSNQRPLSSENSNSALAFSRLAFSRLAFSRFHVHLFTHNC